LFHSLNFVSFPWILCVCLDFVPFLEFCIHPLNFVSIPWIKILYSLLLSWNPIFMNYN
jgi:hypothetical protein